MQGNFFIPLYVKILLTAFYPLKKFVLACNIAWCMLNNICFSYLLWYHQNPLNKIPLGCDDMKSCEHILRPTIGTSPARKHRVCRFFDGEAQSFVIKNQIGIFIETFLLTLKFTQLTWSSLCQWFCCIHHRYPSCQFLLHH